MTADAPQGELPCSVLIGRASIEDHTRILETLAALRQQDCSFPFEVIVVDRLDDEVTRQAQARCPEFRFIACAPDTTLPQMRTAALLAARGRIVAVIEDHCIPDGAWLRSLVGTFDRYPDAVAVGGSVVNDLTTTAFDWATYLCEYASFSPPIAEGPQSSLPGMNTAYLRGVLLSMQAETLRAGFWETTVHPRLAQSGRLLVANERALVRHRKHFSLRWFLAQRYAYSRYFAGLRFKPGAWHLRLAAALLCPALPAVLMGRLMSVVRRKTALTGPALRSLPLLALFYIVWAAGEWVGYLAGPGEALRHIE